MKTRTIIRKGWIILVLPCILLAFTQCKKKETPPAVNERVTSGEIYFNDSLAYRETCTYSGNLLQSLSDYTLDMVEDYRTEFEYSGDRLSRATDYYSFGYDGALKRERMKEILSWSGENPQEVITHLYNSSGTELDKNREVYYYSGNQLRQIVEYLDYSGNWWYTGNTDFLYDSQGRLIMQADSTDDYGQVVEYHYSGSQLSEIVSKHYTGPNWHYNYRQAMQYSGELLVQATGYEWDSAGWVEVTHDTYAYNELGHVKSVTTDFYGYFNYTQTFNYSEGAGNYRQLMEVLAPATFLPGLPLPYPVKGVRKEPASFISDLIKR